MHRADVDRGAARLRTFLAPAIAASGPGVADVCMVMIGGLAVHLRFVVCLRVELGMRNLPMVVLIGALVSGSAIARGDPQGHVGHAVVTQQQAFGIAGDRKAVKRTIDIKTYDTMRFVPETIQVRGGETIRLRVTNKGAVPHELVLGTRKTLAEHAAMMRRFPEMEHDEPHVLHVKPGEAGEIVWTFNRPGRVDFACLVAGHYEAGMVGTIDVAKR